MVLTAAELNVPHRLFLRVDKLRFPIAGAAAALREFIAPGNTPASQHTRDSRAYSCYLLSAMAVRDQPLPRAGLLEYFRLVGADTDLERAAQSALGIGDEELSKAVKDFDRKMHFQPDAWVNPSAAH